MGKSVAKKQLLWREALYMSNSSMLANRMAESQAYWQTEAGRSLWEAQRACLGPVIEGRHGGHGLEIGMGPALMTMSAIPHLIRWFPTRALAASPSSLICPPSQLALPDRCMDTVVIHHWLEHLPDAHFTLQEAARVTADNGVLVLFGFNPMSAKGLAKRLRKNIAAYPWCGQWHTVKRLSDWLAFVDFEVERVDYCGFHGFVSAKCGQHWEAWGRRQNLPLGKSYMIQAKRRQRHAPIERLKFGLRAPVSASPLGATRAGSSAECSSLHQHHQKKDRVRE